MNAKDRKSVIDLQAKLSEVRDALDILATELQYRHDNLPESFQEGEQGTKLWEQSDEMCNIVNDLDDILSRLNDLMEGGG